jgi:hypothetical protein
MEWGLTVIDFVMKFSPLGWGEKRGASRSWACEKDTDPQHSDSHVWRNWVDVRKLWASATAITVLHTSQLLRTLPVAIFNKLFFFTAIFNNIYSCLCLIWIVID